MNNLKFAVSNGPVNNTQLSTWEPDGLTFIKKFSKPTIGPKDGSYFVRCIGTKRSDADTADTADFVIIDGDSRIDSNGKIVAGAPNPIEVHQVLKKLGLSHCIYSSHSNGMSAVELAEKGIDSGGLSGANYHKWRAIIIGKYNREQLKPLVEYVIKSLHEATVMLANAKENYTWAQAWYFPRVPDDDRLSLFKFYCFRGRALEVDIIYSEWSAQQTKLIKPRPTTRNENKNAPMTELERARLASALEYISNDIYQIWLHIGMSIHSADPTERGFEMWRKWSESSSKYDVEHQEKTWRTFNSTKEKAVTLGTLFYMAQKNGWNQLNHSDDNQEHFTHNAVLDTERKYSSVDLLRHVDDDHLLKRLSIQMAVATHMPVSTVFLMLLATFASVSCRKWAVLYEDIQVLFNENTHQLPIGLYVTGEQPSGSCKSWILQIGQKPFWAIQDKVKKDYADRIKRLEEKKKRSEHENNLLKELKNMEKQIKTGLFTTNCTPEGLEMTLPNTGGFFSAVSSEQGLFDSLLGLSYSKGANNNDLTLNAFDGGYFCSVRAGREGFLGKVVGGLVCFAQPGSIEKVLGASHGTGLSERFLMLVEQHSLGTRNHIQDIYIDPDLEDEYALRCKFIEQILTAPSNGQYGLDKLDKQDNLEICNKGHLLIKLCRNKIEPHLADGGKYSHISLRGAASKLNMQIMKIAANLHILETPNPSHQIKVRHVKAAIGISIDLLEANRRLSREKGIMGNKGAFAAILRMFEKTNGKPITERQIIQSRSVAEPFKSYTGNKSALVRKTLAEMVGQKLLSKMTHDEIIFYSIGQ